MVFKNKIYQYAVYKTHLSLKDRWKKTFQEHDNQHKAGAAIILSDKKDFKLKMVKRDKEDHCMVINRSIHRENTTIVYTQYCNI